MAKKKKETALWLVLTQGSGSALCLYFGGLMGLSAMLLDGRVGEGSAFAWIVGLCALAAFVGALVTARRTPWSGGAAGAVTGLVFAAALAVAGLACWGGLEAMGGVLAAAALLGGFCGGLAGGRRRRKRRPSL